MISDLVKLNIAINYSDPENKLSGSILLDADDWKIILERLTSSGYKIINNNIILEVQNGKISSR